MKESIRMECCTLWWSPCLYIEIWCFLWIIISLVFFHQVKSCHGRMYIYKIIGFHLNMVPTDCFLLDKECKKLALSSLHISSKRKRISLIIKESSQSNWNHLQWQTMDKLFPLCWPFSFSQKPDYKRSEYSGKRALIIRYVQLHNYWGRIETVPETKVETGNKKRGWEFMTFSFFLSREAHFITYQKRSWRRSFFPF